jgi:hypothetical protein
MDGLHSLTSGQSIHIIRWTIIIIILWILIFDVQVLSLFDDCPLGLQKRVTKQWASVKRLTDDEC